MRTRLIGIFPTFKNIDALQELRIRFDPLAPRVAPHIPLVPSFSSPLQRFQIRDHLVACLDGFRSFRIELRGLVPWEEKLLLIQLKKGLEEVSALHERTARGVLAPYAPVLPCPGLIVGRFESAAARDAALDAHRFTTRLAAAIDCIEVLLIDDKGSTEEEIRYQL